ncbi:mannose-1-phosphate guanylyltransferase [Clostridium estertheticum]|uniref:mannose-1-phosphate guanylyltransferase n=1 Tax=Clostridium estertheticum TaxID=238834 RepID=A0A7Y3SXR2_9CLOT|nr:mannose-1-phosphate guanylyltransferase [Clostridium estertheticum]NNU77318.1 mannose-1-phosphate guanylyltransferase [Clostridium estertheticum]WBL47053.1 mannose-1-phosphate guanylyltransferase [Clostridium estertheticum]
MLCALIMAGGKGERFWPLSTEDKPKQFLKLLGDYTMIQMTVKRLQKLLSLERIFIVTAKQYVNLIKEQIPNLPVRNIIVEPVGKNTAPCIALSAFIIDKYYKDATLAVVPADHLISDEDNFVKVIQTADVFVNNMKDSIITLGIIPNRPECGYGYINYSNCLTEVDGFEIRKVNKFVEKPNIETAKGYLLAGDFLWNGGMFVWKTSTILNLTNKYLSNTYQILSEISATCDDDYDKVLNKRYKDIDSISVDYAIMENAKDIYVIPCDFGWDDIGTWHSLERYREHDENNNICVGYVNSFESNNNIVVGNNKPIVVVGMDDIFVVESEDMIFIGKKEYIERIKEIKRKVE